MIIPRGDKLAGAAFLLNYGSPPLKAQPVYCSVLWDFGNVNG